MIKINKLLPGAKIGIVAPSRNVHGDRKDIETAIKLLEKHGYKIELGKNFEAKDKRGYIAGDAQKRAEDINNFFLDKKIKAIFCALGGDAANEVLPLLNYKIIKNNPKPILGYSDITHFLLAINAKTGMITFHGPNLSTMSRLNSLSVNQMLRILKGEEKTLLNDFEVIREGKAEGKLLGGNLFVFNSLNKTEYMPDYKDAILFLEDIDEGVSSIRFQLEALNLTGIFEKINGIVIGHNHSEGKKAKEVNNQTLFKLTENFNIPIVRTDLFGHFVKVFYTFPEGAKVRLDTKTRKLELTEDVVI